MQGGKERAWDMRDALDWQVEQVQQQKASTFTTKGKARKVLGGLERRVQAGGGAADEHDVDGRICVVQQPYGRERERERVDETAPTREGSFNAECVSELSLQI